MEICKYVQARRAPTLILTLIHCVFLIHHMNINLKIQQEKSNGILVPVRTSFSLRGRSGKAQNVSTCEVDVDMLNAVKSVLADISSVSPSSEKDYLSVSQFEDVYMSAISC